MMIAYFPSTPARADDLCSLSVSYADDELNVELGNGVKKLTTDLLYDSEGHLKYKPHLWEDVRTVILPALAKNVGYVPIPRIEVRSPRRSLSMLRG